MNEERRLRGMRANAAELVTKELLSLADVGLAIRWSLGAGS